MTKNSVIASGLEEIPLDRITSRWWGHNRGGPDAHFVQRPHLVA